jgi:hypothetical protein
MRWKELYKGFAFEENYRLLTPGMTQLRLFELAAVRLIRLKIQSTSNPLLHNALNKSEARHPNRQLSSCVGSSGFHLHLLN